MKPRVSVDLIGMKPGEAGKLLAAFFGTLPSPLDNAPYTHTFTMRPPRRGHGGIVYRRIRMTKKRFLRAASITKLAYLRGDLDLEWIMLETSWPKRKPVQPRLQGHHGVTIVFDQLDEAGGG